MGEVKEDTSKLLEQLQQLKRKIAEKCGHVNGILEFSEGDDSNNSEAEEDKWKDADMHMAIQSKIKPVKKFESKKHMLYIETPQGPCVPFHDVSEDETIKDLKIRIKEELKVPLHRQELIWRGRPLPDYLRIKQCDVFEAFVLQLMCGRQFTLHIEMIDRTISLIVPYTATINDIKREIYQRDGLRVQRQHIYYNNHELQCEEKLKDLHTMGTVHLRMKFKMQQCKCHLCQNDDDTEMPPLAPKFSASGKRIIGKRQSIDTATLSHFH